MAAAEALRSTVGLATACRALGVGRAGLYRRRHPRRPTVPRPRVGRKNCVTLRADTHDAARRAPADR